MQLPQEVIDGIMSTINGQNIIENEELQGIADELAAGVTAEREAELAMELPAPYRQSFNARAEISDEKIICPRATYTAANSVAGVWNYSTHGRKMARPKIDCVFGVAVDLDMPEAELLIVKIVVLWKRDKS